jgi:N-acetylneuraminic acid mutarotase
MLYCDAIRGLIIHGGRDNKNKNAFNDVNIYNLEHNEWIGVLVSGSGFEQRYGHVSFLDGSKFVVFGGVNYHNFVSTKKIDFLELD